VDPKQDQQMHASRARSAKGIARLKEHQPEEGEQGRNKNLPGKKLMADLLSKIIAVKGSGGLSTAKVPEFQMRNQQ